MILVVAAGDLTEPFSLFYGAQYPGAVRLAHLLTGDYWAAEDLAQDVFLRVQRRFAELANPPAFVQTSIVNACKSHHRRRRREAEHLPRLTGDGGVTESARELLDALDALPYRQKAVLVLRYYSDLTEAEIARVLGCRPGTVKSLAARGLARLGKEITR